MRLTVFKRERRLLDLLIVLSYLIVQDEQRRVFFSEINISLAFRGIDAHMILNH